MTFENKQKITEIDLGWQAADYVSPVVSVENDDKDVDPSKLQFAWFKVESSIQPSDDEEKERIRAMQIQYENKIINKYGMSMPKEFKDVISENEKAKKGSKWDRKRQRLIDRQIEKDMQVERNKAKREQEEIDKLKSTSVNTSTNNITSNIKLTSVLSKLTDT
jgi:hypothetical protein